MLTVKSVIFPFAFTTIVLSTAVAVLLLIVFVLELPEIVTVEAVWEWAKKIEFTKKNDRQILRMVMCFIISQI